MTPPTATGFYDELEENDKKVNTVTVNEVYENSLNKTTKRNKLFDKLNSLRLDPLEEVIQEPAILSAIVEGIEYRMLTAGNLSVVSGPQKAKKTFVLSGIASACVLNEGVKEDINDRKLIMNMFATLGEGKTRILYFDTEQSKYHAQKVNKRILKMAGLEESKNFEYYKLRGLSGPEIVELIEIAIDYYNDIGLICVDGIADLLAGGINNETEANDIIRKFMNLTEKHDLHIATVLHTNKSKDGVTGTLSGWIGTQLLKKVESSFVVEKDKDRKNVSHITAKDTRDLCFDTFAFEVTEDGLPIAIKGGMKHLSDISKILTQEQIKNILLRVNEVGTMNKTGFKSRLLVELVHFQSANKDIVINPTVRRNNDFFTNYLIYQRIVNEKQVGKVKVIELDLKHSLMINKEQQEMEL